jgi:hypothetical protein
MAKYVCPIHEDVILFKEDEEKDSRHIPRAPEVRIIPPQYCEKCRKYYYKHECPTK